MAKKSKLEPICWTDAVLTMLANGWRLSEIARHVGLSRSAMCDIAKGRHSEPKGFAAVLLYAARNDPPPSRRNRRAS